MGIKTYADQPRIRASRTRTLESAVTNARCGRRRRPVSPARRLTPLALVTADLGRKGGRASVGSLAAALRYFLRSPIHPAPESLVFFASIPTEARQIPRN